MEEIKREFDKMNFSWEPNAEFNMYFLRCQQDYMNRKLQARGHVFLNEVFDALGFERTRQGQTHGWVLGEGKVNHVDFGLPNQLSLPLQDSVTLTFNVDGDILDHFLEDA